MAGNRKNVLIDSLELTMGALSKRTTQGDQHISDPMVRKALEATDATAMVTSFIGIGFVRKYFLCVLYLQTLLYR